jgi:hypothetical protein
MSQTAEKQTITVERMAAADREALSIKNPSSSSPREPCPVPECSMNEAFSGHSDAGAFTGR